MKIKPRLSTLKKHLRYDPIKGEFWWIYAHKLDRPTDRPAGCVQGKNKCGYRQIYFSSKPYMASHLAFVFMTGKWPKKQVDHINMVRTDDRWNNLRLATRTQNFANQHAYKSNSSGFKGVHLFKPTGKWVAQIQVKNKRILLGHHVTPELAHAAYVQAAKKYFGEFARFQ